MRCSDLSHLAVFAHGQSSEVTQQRAQVLLKQTGISQVLPRQVDKLVGVDHLACRHIRQWWRWLSATQTLLVKSRFVFASYFASCDPQHVGFPALTSECQDEGATNARREGKSVGGWRGSGWLEDEPTQLWEWKNFIIVTFYCFLRSMKPTTFNSPVPTVFIDSLYSVL